MRKVRTGNAGVFLMLLMGLLLLVDSCAKMVPIREADYRNTDPRRDETYRLTTREDRVYDFDRFMVTDSTLIILEVKTYDTPSFLNARRNQEPVVVAWESVKSLERFDYNNKVTRLMIAAGAAGALYVTCLVLAAIILSPIRFD